MSTSFIVRLHNALKDFRIQEAETLSDAIHAAEAEGYKISTVEDRLWAKLTSRIVAYRSEEEERHNLLHS